MTSIRQRIHNIYYFFPIQLFILHFRKYQILLVLWFFLLGVINSTVMQNFGADSLFLSPEYLEKVNFLSCFITGIALGVFVMSWNITTFILHSKRFHFLATTEKPFLRYCINNAGIPLVFIIIYLTRLFTFNDYGELLPDRSIWLMIAGILLGVLLLAAISFIYFFGAERTIKRSLAPLISNPDDMRQPFSDKPHATDAFGMHVSYFLSTRLHFRKVRPVSHYPRQYIEIVFKKHHFSAIISIGLSFLFLVAVGYLLDNPVFELPAAASILLFSAILIAVTGAFTYFLKSWSILFIVLFIFMANFLLKKDLIDPANKAYGLNYDPEIKKPAYNNEYLQSLSSPAIIRSDKNAMLSVLEKWKQRQGLERPVMFFINVSGGGLRSATFTMNTLQQLDSLSGGRLMKKTFLISGASGGMLAATYFREIYRRHLKDNDIPLYSADYTDNISKDLLNPVFSSLIARDLLSPVQKFSVGKHQYLKDRGYAFERKLSRNTYGFLDIQLGELTTMEKNAEVPLIYFNPVVKNDGRRLVISTLPASFMMKPALYAMDSNYIPDAIDFSSMFLDAEPQNVRILTALRMSATFPYVLPGVRLPSVPAMDVMDAGLRDNYGLETSLRFIDHFRNWISANTGGVVILQLRDRPINDQEEKPRSTPFADMVLGPATTLQYNWYRIQDYYQSDDFSFFESAYDSSIRKIALAYYPSIPEKGARLNFHLTNREKKDIIQSLQHPANTEQMKTVLALLKD